LTEKSKSQFFLLETCISRENMEYS